MNFEILTENLQDQSLPALIIDLDALDRNIQRITAQVQANGKVLRVATKSIRIPELFRYIQVKMGKSHSGWLCYSLTEAAWLFEQGFRDLVIAYPAVQKTEFLAVRDILLKDESAFTFMVDHEDHLKLLQSFVNQFMPEKQLSIAIDVDVSYRPFGDWWGVHLGVQRSSIRNASQFIKFLDRIQAVPQLKLRGIMGYEAQIAGLGDASPFQAYLNPIKRILKSLSQRDVLIKRHRIRHELQTRGISLHFFNGGGSGSLNSTTAEGAITEVTVGSGFLQPHLFDYYRSNINEAAIFFALRVTRLSQTGIITCQSGGFIASGEIGREKAPLALWPPGLSPIAAEGFGEVQTPFQTKAPLSIGSVILCRPAKSGEICERFSKVLFVRNGEIQSLNKTYRGLGLDFF